MNTEPKNFLGKRLQMAIYISKSPSDTLNFASEYAKSLKAGDVVLLEGDLGAGKTVFCKGLARGLGVTEEVLSPTYAYMNDYGGKFYHFDCYRLSCGEQAEALGLTDYFYADGVCAVEWWRNISSVLPENCRRVNIKKTGEQTREIEYE